MVSKEDIKDIADLCKLKFDEEEIEDFTEMFSQVLEHVDKLKEVDTEGIEPTYHINEHIQPLREDVAKEGLPRKDVLKNTMEEQYGYFKLLRIMD